MSSKCFAELDFSSRDTLAEDKALKIISIYVKIKVKEWVKLNWDTIKGENIPGEYPPTLKYQMK